MDEFGRASLFVAVSKGFYGSVFTTALRALKFCPTRLATSHSNDPARQFEYLQRNGVPSGGCGRLGMLARTRHATSVVCKLKKDYDTQLSLSLVFPTGSHRVTIIYHLVVVLWQRRNEILIKAALQ